MSTTSTWKNPTHKVQSRSNTQGCTQVVIILRERFTISGNNMGFKDKIYGELLFTACNFQPHLWPLLVTKGYHDKCSGVVLLFFHLNIIISKTGLWPLADNDLDPRQLFSVSKDFHPWMMTSLPPIAAPRSSLNPFPGGPMENHAFVGRNPCACGNTAVNPSSGIHRVTDAIGKHLVQPLH